MLIYKGGAIVSDEPITSVFNGVITTLTEELPEEHTAYYGAKYFLCESSSLSFAIWVAAHFGKGLKQL
jgi:hypothetical protein